MPTPCQIQLRSKRFGTVSQRSRGFTLIELLTVILLITILSAISLRLVDTVQERQREGRAKSDLDALGLALEQFMLSNSTYPEYHADNKHLSDYNDARGFPDEKKSSEALFLALAGWHNERGEALDLKGDADAGEAIFHIIFAPPVEVIAGYLGHALEIGVANGVVAYP